MRHVLTLTLSFTCGIFGMNVKEINDSPLSLWTVMLTVMFVMLFTVALFGAYKAWSRWRPKPKAGENVPGSGLPRRCSTFFKDPAKMV